jgi:hypothetical protein
MNWEKLFTFALLRYRVSSAAGNMSAKLQFPFILSPNWTIEGKPVKCTLGDEGRAVE